jgi:hypothetical protein
MAALAMSDWLPRFSNSHRADPINGSSMTISKYELAEIAPSGYPEMADEDPRRAAEAVGLFISGTIAYLDRTACNSVAPLCYAVTPALRRNRCTVTGAVTVSRFGREEVPHRGAARAPAGRCVSTQLPFLTATSSLSP